VQLCWPGGERFRVYLEGVELGLGAVRVCTLQLDDRQMPSSFVELHDERELVRAVVGVDAGAAVMRESLEDDNLPIFCVGDGKPDSFTFSVGELEPGWEARLVGAAWETLSMSAVGAVVRWAAIFVFSRGAAAAFDCNGLAPRTLAATDRCSRDGPGCG
jgi:hypothetical protein